MCNVPGIKDFVLYFDQRYLEFEDAHEQEKRDLSLKVDSLEHLRKQSEVRTKHLQDQGKLINVDGALCEILIFKSFLLCVLSLGLVVQQDMQVIHVHFTTLY